MGGGGRAGPWPEIPVVAEPGPCLANACSACCRGTEMILTEADVARLAEVRPGEPFFFQAPDGFLQLRTRKGAPEDAGLGGPPCHFLGRDGRCTVHDVRPEGCRLYPAVWDEVQGRAMLDGEVCPHTGGFRLDAATGQAVERLVETLERERRARVR